MLLHAELELCYAQSDTDQCRSGRSGHSRKAVAQAGVGRGSPALVSLSEVEVMVSEVQEQRLERETPLQLYWRAVLLSLE